MKQSTETMQDQFSATGKLNLGVRLVPEAEVNPGILNGS
jgi:hypothetical protein